MSRREDKSWGWLGLIPRKMLGLLIKPGPTKIYRSNRTGDRAIRSCCWLLVTLLGIGIFHGCHADSIRSDDSGGGWISPRVEANSHEPSAKEALKPEATYQSSNHLQQKSQGTTEVPANPYLGDSPWPIFHRNAYAQASTPLRGPEPGDTFTVDVLHTDIGGPSPWTLLSESYADGTRVIWGGTTTHVFKAVARGDQFELVDSYRIDRNRFSFHWNLAILKGNKVIVADRGRNRYYKFADADPKDWRSKIVLEDTFEIPESIPGSAGHFSLSYDGWIIFVTDAGYVVAVSSDFSQYRSLKLPQDGKETNFHNTYALDETGGIFIATTSRMLRVDWRDTEFSLAWDIPYDFRGPGCERVNRRRPAREFLAVARGEPCTGSGTTPTLVGSGRDDKLVVVADGHSPSNHLVAFWRDTIPADWQGIAGYDRQVAGIATIPYSTPDGDGFTAENSPTAWGYDIAIAQYNGFKPGCNPVKGVQKFRWNPQTRSLDLVWATDQINFNNVLTYSEGSNLVYGSGRRECIYYFWGLNWNTGDVELEISLGDSRDYLDQGNQVTIGEDRTVFFGSATGLVRIRPQQS